MISVGFMLFCFVSSSREIVFIASVEKRQLSVFLPLHKLLHPRPSFQI